MAAVVEQDEFYHRYYVVHKGKFGYEFLEFRCIIAENKSFEIMLEIMTEDDNSWPELDRVGRQELEIIMGNEHISFTTSKIRSLVDIQSNKDPEGFRILYYLVQKVDIIDGTSSTEEYFFMRTLAHNL